MSDQPTQPDPPAPESPAIEPTPSRGWRDAWQLPVAFLGLVLLVLGIAAAIKRAPGPDFEGVLNDAETLIATQDPASALDLLNGPIVQAIGRPGAASPELLARFHALRGESLFLAHRINRAPMNTPAAKTNNTRTLEELIKAEHLSHEQITPRRAAFIAETLLDLDRVDEALAHLEHLPAEEADRRRRLYKRIINEGLVGTPAYRQRALRVLDRFREDPGLDESDRIWAVVQYQRAALARGEADRVIDEVLPEIPRLESTESSEAADLHILLGDAYFEVGNIEQSRTHLSLAEAILTPGDERRGYIDESLARIAQSKGDIEEARDRYASVVERFPGSDAHAQALLGLGETEADLGHPEESLNAYRKLVERIRENGRAGAITPERAEQSMEQRYRIRAAAGDLDTALLYADLIVRAYPPSHAPASALLRLAETHRDIASNLVGGLANEYESAGRLSLLDPETVEQSRVHLAQSGAAYEQHARAAMVASPEEASASLWNAADLLDRAGEQNEAIRLFTEYAYNRKQDPKQLESKFRLGRCFQSLNQYTTAISLFEDVIRANPGSDEAFRSYVPLAQCYLLASNDADSDKAEALLLRVLDGRLFKPDAPQFKRALLELGALYLRVDRFPDAIARLHEAIERYPDAPEETRLMFDLADANRLSAAQVEKQLKDAMPISERAELERIRTERLRAALDLYEKVRSRLEASDPTRLTPLQRIILRNSTLYRGDCAFDLGDYELAIRHYDAAAQRLANEPASLVPMVQIVNCYAALGRLPEARTAHERAKSRLKEIPESTWQGAAVPMDRRHWERWLESSLRLDQLEAKASTASATP
ncbi:MAG: tetratricopeptide repeat protein [Phycisphaerae bacterium]|nr:tetratricopeptide repeat protein [Phycisphaerae bacterium]